MTTRGADMDRAASRWQVKATNGDTFLGGEDFDIRLLEVTGDTFSGCGSFLCSSVHGADGPV